MDGKLTLKYVAFYQLLAGIATIVGFGIVGLGVMFGFGDAIAIVLEDAPQNFNNAVNAANPFLFAVLSVIGLLVWQLGKTFALVVTMGKVATANGGSAAAGAAGAEVPDRVTDRIASLESDVKSHQKRLSKATSNSSNATASGSGSSASASKGSESESRRSRRRGSAATGSAESSDGESASSKSSSSERAERRSNRRASRSSSSDSTDSESGSGTSE